ncbi:hypothetical protein ASD11_01595 [Aeromicrobium sp. Root495]|uniref:LPXTG cell wall anchor domain-containing protein n=1 Tax=Aeromicrobium sp. Root495 TaxID=1736550 RepID=UPI0006F6F6A2|nr:LPXTG cell wall anchor domain-containing protein [Aeromicrobium sp. Root495]KQY58386.1 hypothetical protein ASD11_01595 [Aeromicrobium sp. Root495]
MKRMHLLVALVLAAFVAALVPSTAFAADDTYPDPTLSVKVPGGKLYGGDPVSVSASASVRCSPLSLTFLGDTVSTKGSSLTNTFDTPVVKTVTPKKVTASCTYTDASGASATVTGDATVTPAAFVGPLPGAVRSASATVILLPRAADDGADNGSQDNGNGILPNTGGLPFWLLIAGVVLVLGGGVIATRRRRG